MKFSNACNVKHLLLPFLFLLDSSLNADNLVVLEVLELTVGLTNTIRWNSVQWKVKLLFWEKVFLAFKKFDERRANSFQNVKLLERVYHFFPRFWQFFSCNGGFQILFHNFLGLHGGFELFNFLIFV